MSLLCDPIFIHGERERFVSIISVIRDSRNRWAHADISYDPSKIMESIDYMIGYLELKNDRKAGMKFSLCTWHGP
jgi:predicted transcriptional regulator